MTELLIYLAGLLLIAAAAWAVASPLFRESEGPAEASPSPERDRWRRQKEEAIAGIRDAEFDFHLGKLSEADYRSLRARLEAEALEAITRLEEKPDDPAR